MEEYVRVVVVVVVEQVSGCQVDCTGEVEVEVVVEV